MLVERGRISSHQTPTARREELLESGLMEIPVDGEIGILVARPCMLIQPIESSQRPPQ